MPGNLDYALLAANSYAASTTPPDVSTANTLPVPSGWSILDSRDDPFSGFTARAYARGTEIVIAYAGTSATGSLLQQGRDWLFGNVTAGRRSSPPATACPPSSRLTSRSISFSAPRLPAPRGSRGKPMSLSKMHAGLKRNFQVMPGAEWLELLCRHIPDRYEHLVRYVGWYSNRARGERAKAGKDQDAPSTGAAPTEPVSELLARAKAAWARLIRKVYEADPLVCPSVRRRCESSP